MAARPGIARLPRLLKFLYALYGSLGETLADREERLPIYFLWTDEHSSKA